MASSGTATHRVNRSVSKSGCMSPCKSPMKKISECCRASIRIMPLFSTGGIFFFFRHISEKKKNVDAGKMNICKTILVALVLYYLVFHTPHCVSNFAIGKSTKLSSIFRDTRNGDVYAYESNHGNSDGTRYPKLIQQGQIRPKKLDVKVYPFMGIKNVPKHPVYSSFTMVCSHICYYYLPKRRLKIGIFVNKRSTMEKGNFFIFTTYHADPTTMSIEDIQKAQHSAVALAKKSRKKYMTIRDVFACVSCDFIFNSHRMMSNIELNDGTILKEVRKEPFQYRMEDLANVKTPFYPLPFYILFGHDGTNYQIKDMQFTGFGSV